jgi:hypothetical protein
MTVANILWMYLLPLIAVLAPIWLGQRYGLYVKSRSRHLEEGPVSSAVAGIVGLFAFLLAFTFQIVGDRYSKRKELLLSEVSEIRTTFLYSGLVPEPLRGRSRQMIKKYVDIRVELLKDNSKLKPVMQESQVILDSLWSYAEELAVMDRSSEAYSLYMASVNSVITLFNERITVTFQARLPRTVLCVLAFVAFFAMWTVGYQFGISGKVSTLMNLLLGITFAAVMWLIFAMDNPVAGLIKLVPKPFYTLQEQLHSYK